MDQVLAEQVQKFDNFAIYYLAGFVVVMAVALFFWGIFITHRVAWRSSSFRATCGRLERAKRRGPGPCVGGMS